MLKLPSFCIVVLLVFVSYCSFSQAKDLKKITFSFILKNESLTSAGAYKKDGTLLRTIWSGVKYKAGTHKSKWDGLDDQGRPVSDSAFEIKVLTSSVKYEWEGAYIGNSSTGKSGSTRLRVFDNNSIQNITSTAGKVYVASGYAEGWPAEFHFDTATANSKVWVGKTGITGCNTTHVATDGTKVFWAGFDPFQSGPSESFVFVTSVADNSQLPLSNSVNAKMEWDNSSSVTYKAISHKIEANSVISGLAVQKTGNKLFVTRGNQNELQVINKNTGALIKTITIKNAAYVGVDNTDNLWLIHDGNVLEKYTVNVNGTITSAGVTITSMSLPGGFGFKPDGTTISVCDLTSQIVRDFSTTTGAALSTLGTPGGYLTNSTVSNDKFYFRDIRLNYATFVHYLQDGSFYVGDGANLRLQQYNEDRSFRRSIMMQSTSYFVQAVKNEPTRVFNDYLEYEIDYSKPLAANNGSWKLKRNWRGVIPETQYSTHRIQNITTFNGRTYGRSKINGVTYELVEFVNNGVVRFTGIYLGQYGFLNPDGSKMVIENARNYKKYALNRFDVNNNPVWSTTGVYLSNIPTADANDPLIRNNNYDYPVTENGKLVSFDFSRIDTSIGNEYHIGIVNPGGSSYMARTARGTQRSYQGEFPRDGAFDNGNGVESFHRAGGSALTYKNNIFWGYHGEFWKQSQTNIWNIVDANTGLFVGQFGAIKKDYGMAEAPPQVAGNVFGGSVVEVDGQVYLYHNDEGINNGVHRWKISGLNTVEVQTVTVLGENNPINEGVDLLEGITRALTTLPNNFHGWTRIPQTNSLGTYIAVGNMSYDKLKPANLSFAFNQPKGNSAVFSRDLGVNKNLTNWSIKGKINYQYNSKSEFDLSSASFLDVVDAAGKQIARFDLRQAANQSGTYNLRGNDVVLTGGTTDKNVYSSRNEDFEMTYDKDSIKFSFAGYTATTKNTADPKADAKNPKYFRFYAYTAGFQTPKFVSILELYFFGLQPTGIYYKSISSGDWSNVATWQYSTDNNNWVAAKALPDTNANSIIIKSGNVVSISNEVLTDNLQIEKNAILNILPGGIIRVNDGNGDDITISKEGKIIVKSDSTGTGIIGQSTGTIKGDVEVQRYLPAKQSAGFHLLTPSVNSNGTIKDNWQEGVSNQKPTENNNPVEGFGTHITGSINGSDGFDASETGQSSLFTFNWLTNTPVWIPVGNTNTSKLYAKTGYLIYVRGDRSIGLNNSTNQTTSTILRATGSVVTGTVNYNSLLVDGKHSVIANPYASPIDWDKIQAANSGQFENYYTIWDPNVGTKGGYVTVDATGIKSVRTSEATTDIQSGQAFIVKAKKGTISTNFVITENDKSRVNNRAVFRGATVTPKLYASLYYVDENTGNRNLADGILTRFNEEYLRTVDGDDAEDISNFEENISLKRNFKDLSIESRPLPKPNDTLYLNITNMKQQAYEWQFDASDFNTSSQVYAFLIDSYLNTEIPVETEGPTVVVFAITSDPKSYRQDRFKVVFDKLKTLPLSLLSINATKHTTGVNVEWKTTNELNLENYAVERSSDGLSFTQVAIVKPLGTFTSVNNYIWYDEKPVNGYNYYRIKSINKDGTFELTKTVRVLITSEQGSLNVYPNPIPDKKFTVSIPNLQKGDYTLQLINYAGQLMATKQVKHNGGDLIAPFDTGIISKGSYKFSIKSIHLNQTENLIKL